MLNVVQLDAVRYLSRGSNGLKLRRIIRTKESVRAGELRFEVFDPFNPTPTMRRKTVAIYYFLGELLLHTQPAWARPADPRRRSSDVEELATVLVAAHYFGGNLVRRRYYLEQH